MADEDEEEWEGCPGKFESIRTPTGLEIGCKIDWPGSTHLQLTTTLPETAIAPMFDGTQWAGTRIWRASLVCLHYVLEEIRANRLQCTRLLELGSGLGVPGMVLHSITDCYALLSDKEDLVEQLNANIASNFPDSTMIEASALDWNPKATQALVDQNGPFDLVLNCDCIYQPLYGDSWQALLDCQYALLKENPSTVIITSVERRKADGIADYIKLAQDFKLMVERLTIPFDHPPEVEMYRLSLESKQK